LPKQYPIKNAYKLLNAHLLSSDGQITNEITSPNHKSFAKMI